jgi:hypothetical protein
MNARALQDLPLLTFKKCSKFYDCFNPLFINQIKERAS